MKCVEARNRISRLSVSPDQRVDEALERHVAGCLQCQGWSNALNAAEAALHNLPEVQSREGGWERFVAVVDQPQRHARLVPTFALGFCCLVLVVGTMWLSRVSRPVITGPQIVVQSPNKIVTKNRIANQTQETSVKNSVTKQKPQALHRHYAAVRHKRVIAFERRRYASLAIEPRQKIETPEQSQAATIELPETTSPQFISECTDGLLASGLSVLVEASNAESPEGTGRSL
jgi:hypothetical protein